MDMDMNVKFHIHGNSAKISFAFHFWHKSFILDGAKLAELSNNSF